MLVRNERYRIRWGLIVLIVMSIVFISCYEAPITSMENINSPDLRTAKKTSDALNPGEQNPDESDSRKHVRLIVRNDLPFNQEIYQLLDILGSQLTNNTSNLELRLDMQVTRTRAIRLQEDGTEGISEYEKELWRQLKTAISDLLWNSPHVDVGVKIKYVNL